MTHRAPIIGVDLGTTNSCAAFCDENGNVKLIPYRGGEYTVPSIYAVDERGNELVGYEAKRQWQLNPKNTVYGSKRMVGISPGNEIAQTMKKVMQYEIKEGDRDDMMVHVGRNDLRLHEISGKILAKIRDVASNHLGTPVNRAVVTVPAYFNDKQRQAVRESGKGIGLDIVRIINEPTAAALAYGARDNTNQTVAIYDLGGGTFDVSVIEIRNRVFEVKATGGDIFLGGIDFDNRIVDYILLDFKSKHNIDLRNDPVAMQRIRDVAERVKIDLSERNEVPISIPFVTMTDDGKPVDISMTMNREELDLLVENLVEKTFVTVASVLDDAKKTIDQIDAVLLVGGQTRMPTIQQRIKDFFGKAPSKGVHPDEAVAVGAALYAWSLDERSDMRVQLLDVLPMAIGIEGVEGQMHRLFERNSSVPNKKAFTFTTHKDNQPDLNMRIFQGDKDAATQNQLLGEFVFSGLRSGPAASVRVEVVFDITGEGILGLDAKDLDTGAQMQQTVRFGSS